MKRIHQLYVISFVLLALLLSACGGENTGTETPVQPPQPPPPANNTLSGTVVFPPGSGVTASGTVLTACVLVGQACDPQQSVATTAADGGTFSLQVTPGIAYTLFAFKDTNANNARDNGDYEGQAPTPVTAPASNLSLQMNPVQGGDTPPPPPPPPTGQGEISGTVLAPPSGDVQGSLVAACFLETDTDGSLTCNLESPNTRITTLNTAGSSVPFTFTDLAAGQYGVLAQKDVNGNDQLDAGDYSGCYGNAQGCLAVTPPQSGLSIQMNVESGDDTPPPPGSISGMLIFPGGDVNLEPPDGATNDLREGGDFFDLSPAKREVSSDFVPGEVIVKYKPGLRLQSLTTADGQALTLVRNLALPQTGLLRRENLDKAETLALVAELERQPDVLYAQPNYINYALKTPDDEYYGAQWHYPAMNLPAAWDIQDGTGNPVTVAVVDTGFVSHPDLEGVFVGGFDFVSDPAIAADGDGRDADATDLGQDSGYHGTHVAGTIAARSNNGTGVAGVNWGATVVPVRVLGVTGTGTLADIIDGMLWAAGEPVAGVPANPNPARVVNLSLGSQRPCESFEQEAYNTLQAKGVISVVAAGNDGEDAGFYAPANCQGVITVGATGPQGDRAPYSNYGTTIDVMAPGGDVSQTFEFNGENYIAGVLSTLKDDATGEFYYGFYQGTSMAAPHVAGLVSLMLASDPSLTFETVLARLQSSAVPLSAEQCNRSAGTDCGAGLVDAAGALSGSGGTPTPPPPPPPPPPTGNVDTYVAALYCTTSACTDFDTARSGEAIVPVDGNQVPFTVEDLEPGTYIAAAWQDLNGDVEVTEGEPFGLQRAPVVIEAGQGVTGVVIELEPYRASSEATTADLSGSFSNLLLVKSNQRYLKGDFGSLKEALLDATPQP